ncbi:MAG TPA: NUDIX hydrolase [Acidimicrobiales bacterium]|nr:NUDIX hydrolase [Acidimicrobiales bacterium]
MPQPARAAAGVLFLDDEGRVLMVVPSYKDALEIPGGGVEPGETPYAAARREVREEIGIAPPVGRLLVAGWWSDSPDGVGGPKILFVFDGGRLADDHRDRIVVDGAEIVGWGFRPVPELAALTVARLANRIAHAVAARHDGTTRYLEDGHWMTGGV